MPAASIPASDIVSVTPGVLAPGGTGASLIALLLSQSYRVPMGLAMSFSTAASVGAYFGLGSPEYDWAEVYFAGFNGGVLTPASLQIVQCPPNPVGAYLRGAATGLTLAQLTALTAGTLTVTIDGNVTTSGSINLSSATSFSNAASIIQTALAESDVSFTGAIAPAAASVTGAISGTTLTVSAVGSGSLIPGMVLSGSGVTANTTIVAQLTGTTGGVGTYSVTPTQTASSTTITGASSLGLMTVSAVASGALAANQNLSGSGVSTGTTIVSQLTGTAGSTGIYIVSLSQTVSSETIKAGNVAVFYDSVLGTFSILAGSPGAGSTMTYAATSALATSLGLTQAAGAVLSQGSAAVGNGAATTMAAFMAGVAINATASFSTINTTWELPTADGVSLAGWNSLQGNRYIFVAWDTDPNALLSGQSQTLGAQVLAATDSGTVLLWEPTNLLQDAFVSGLLASVNFNAPNGRVNPTYKNQSGITPGVTSITQAAQLRLNGYNFYGAWATATQQFQGLSPGSITGPFAWIDSYANQIWLNAALQNAIMNLMFDANFIPYNAQGTAAIRASCNDPIQAGLYNGVIQNGVTLSSNQITEVDAQAGLAIDGVLYQQGWYLLVGTASPTVRAASGSPPMSFFYTDGGSVQQIALSSTDVA